MSASSILAYEFLRHAKEFLDAAARLKEGKPFLSHPTFYCVLHSIELSLKTHLAHAGFARAKLASKAYGHNLAELLKAADASGTLGRSSLNAFDRRAIVFGAEDYAKKCFEYPEFMVSTYSIGKWLCIARKLTGSAESVISSQTSSRVARP